MFVLIAFVSHLVVIAQIRSCPRFRLVRQTVRVSFHLVNVMLVLIVFVKMMDVQGFPSLNQNMAHPLTHVKAFCGARLCFRILIDECITFCVINDKLLAPAKVFETGLLF